MSGMSGANDLDQKARLKIVLTSLIVGAAILVFKYLAFSLTGSAALKSDAIESIVNVVSAMFALGALIFAGKPADREHPYGHGKIEHFSAAFEGGLIALASVLIIFEAVKGLVQGVELHSLSTGLLLNLGAGGVNGLLGWHLIRSGKKLKSKALEADGHHVLSDFYTTLGIGAGLLLVKLTGLSFLDPLIALGVGLWLARTGYHLVRESSMALLDQEDPVLVQGLVDIINRIRPDDIIALHELRTLRVGRYVHVDVHFVVPEYYPVGSAHDLVEGFGMKVIREAGLEGEFHTHTDPCGRLFCVQCPMATCPVRQAPFNGDRKLSLEQAVGPGPVELGAAAHAAAL